jgi:aminopeptidase N
MNPSVARRISAAGCVLFLTVAGGAQEPGGTETLTPADRALVGRPDLLQAMENISGSNIFRLVTLFCADQFAGREAGTPGARRAADHVAAEFTRLGLRPGGDKGGYLQSFPIFTPDNLLARNVIGVLPGGDERLRREAVVIGAHYDHLGSDVFGTFPGANDNAAGVGAMLEIARVIAGLPARPRRTIIFIAFGAEEIGRMGSLHYVDRPFLPMADTVLMINFDMIGRNGPNEIFAVGTRTSRALHELHQAANEHVGLRIEHPASLRLGRSDHSSFYMADVPIMYLFGGLHVGYHSSDDTPEHLTVTKLGRVARLAFLTAAVTADRTERLTFGDGAAPVATGK